MSMQIQGPTNEDVEDASIPMPVENVTGTVRRKGAMRTFPWLLRAAELNLVVPLPARTLPLTATLPLPLPPVIEEAPPQEDEEEDLLIPPVAKRPRLETSLEHALVEDEANNELGMEGRLKNAYPDYSGFCKACKTISSILPDTKTSLTGITPLDLPHSTARSRC
jgi:hypothetical protein